MGAVDFRVGGRIFATLASVKDGFGNLVSEPLVRPQIGRLVIALSIASGVSPHATTPAFTPTGSMHVARAGHQATLLLDGRVLVTGGHDNSGSAVAQGEIFSAGTGMWSVIASNIVARTDHAATRLRDGRVLVVGGASSLSSCNPNETAEIYDPATDRWSLTGNLPITVGSGMIAVPLRDGRVLVSGGNRCGKVFGTAALFNGGNARVLVFDNSLNLRATYDGIGRPWALCITNGRRQYLYSSSNPEVSDSTKGLDAEVYKLELDGTIVGRFGGSDNPLGGFRTLHLIDCRHENEILATSFPDWVQTITLQP